VELVFASVSPSRRDHPKAFTESRNDVEAMIGASVGKDMQEDKLPWLADMAQWPLRRMGPSRCSAALERQSERPLQGLCTTEAGLLRADDLHISRNGEQQYANELS
jgi:hypothetical protein